jgi:predicted GNAT family acetyltransferase
MSDVVHERDRRRFVMSVEGREAVIDYGLLGDNVLDFRHTFVPRELRGRGIASDLTRQALDLARAEGFKIVPSCPFTATFIDRHAAYRDLVA